MISQASCEIASTLTKIMKKFYSFIVEAIY
jgi:hypothetical protein